MTIKSFAENDFSLFSHTFLKKLDNLTDAICLLAKDVENLQDEFNEYKQSRCKCKRRSERHSQS